LSLTQNNAEDPNQYTWVGPNSKTLLQIKLERIQLSLSILVRIPI